MSVIRSTCVVSFLLLSACASRQAAMEAQPNFNTPASKAKAEVIASANGKVDTKNKTAEAEALDINTKGMAPATKNRQTSAASSISSWDISGAMAARSKGKGWSASLNWLQQGMGRYQIRLSGPLGSGTIMISKNGSVVTLKDGPKTVSSSDANALLRKETGVSLPVASLYYWVRGVPAPGAIQGEKRDQYGRLTVLKQAGYVIEYPQYTSAGKAVLPSSVRLQGNGVFIKLIIKNWRI